ncbi:hypothetical protein Tco_1238470 [Tanacetum coccineum]
MAPKRTTRSTPVTPTPNATTTTTVTEAQLQALIDRGVAAAMAEAEASRVRNGYDSNGSGPRPAQAVRECSYSEFLKCKPLDFKGTEGVVGLTRWFEKIESVFSISNCTASCQVKFATCTLQDDALTCVKASKPKTMQEAIEFTTELMDEKTYAYAERQAEKKRKYDDFSKNNQNQQQQNKRQNIGQGSSEGVCGWKGGENQTTSCRSFAFLNNRYASILFNTGADRSFVSTAFKAPN